MGLSLGLDKGQGKGKASDSAAVHQKNDDAARYRMERSRDSRSHSDGADSGKRLKQDIGKSQRLYRHDSQRRRDCQ